MANLENTEAGQAAMYSSNVVVVSVLLMYQRVAVLSRRVVAPPLALSLLLRRTLQHLAVRFPAHLRFYAQP